MYTRKKDRKQKRRKDRLLMFFELLDRIWFLIKRGFRKFRRGRYFRLAMLGVILAAVGLGSVVVHGAATSPNALQVYVNNSPAGTVRWSRGGINAEYLRTHATARIEGGLGGRVHIPCEILATPARVGRNGSFVSFDVLVTNIVNMLDYYVYAALLLVDGTEAASLPSVPAAHELLSEIARYFYDYSENITHYSFVEDIAIEERLLHRSIIKTAQEARQLLTTPRPVHETYTVQPGDSLYLIAQRTGMGLNALLAANPAVNPANWLRAGDRLNVIWNVPILSVRTFERVGGEEIVRINGVITERRWVD